MGNDDYPDNLLSAYHLMNEYKCWQPKTAPPDSSSVAFAQKGKGKYDNTKNRDNWWQKKATCHHCGEIRHNCPTLKGDDHKDTDGDKADIPSKSTKDMKTAENEKKKTSFAQPLAELENESESRTQFLNFGFSTTSSAPMKLHNMILLNNQSTGDLFCKAQARLLCVGDK
jgi:hypothetical protein